MVSTNFLNSSWWVSHGKSTGVVCHCLLQRITFCQNSLVWPILLGWPYTAWLIASLSYTSPLDTTRQWSMKRGLSLQIPAYMFFRTSDFIPAPLLLLFWYWFFVFEFSAILLCFTLVPLYIFKILPVREIKFFCLPLSSWRHVMNDPPRSTLVVTDVTLSAVAFHGWGRVHCVCMCTSVSLICRWTFSHVCVSAAVNIGEHVSLE